jgi:hypothetical protein
MGSHHVWGKAKFADDVLSPTDGTPILHANIRGPRYYN